MTAGRKEFLRHIGDRELANVIELSPLSDCHNIKFKVRNPSFDSIITWGPRGRGQSEGSGLNNGLCVTAKNPQRAI